MASIACVLLGGCFGDPPEVEPGEDASSESGDESSSEGGGDEVELLVNGSFEDWSDAAPLGWTNGDAVSIEQIEADVVDGDLAARVVSMDYDSIAQYAAMGLPAGTCLDVTLSTRWEAGHGAAPSILFRATDVDGELQEAWGNIAWGVDGQWHETTMSLQVEQDWIDFILYVVSNAPGEQTFSIDAASLRIVGC